jgi:hypothetical protein
MRSRVWCAVAVLTFVAAFVPGLAPAAHADSDFDVYAADFTCFPAVCDVVPTAANGNYFATGDLIVDYGGIDFNVVGLLGGLVSQPGDSFKWEADLNRTVGFGSFQIVDLSTHADITYPKTFTPFGTFASIDVGTLTFVDQTTKQPAPEPASIALLALGLGAVAFFSRRRKASAKA